MTLKKVIKILSLDKIFKYFKQNWLYPDPNKINFKYLELSIFENYFVTFFIQFVHLKFVRPSVKTFFVGDNEGGDKF